MNSLETHLSVTFKSPQSASGLIHELPGCPRSQVGKKKKKKGRLVSKNKFVRDVLHSITLFCCNSFYYFFCCLLFAVLVQGFKCDQCFSVVDIRDDEKKSYFPMLVMVGSSMQLWQGTVKIWRRSAAVIQCSVINAIKLTTLDMWTSELNCFLELIQFCKLNLS